MDPILTQLIGAVVIGAGGFFVATLRKPQHSQEKLMWMAAAAVGAYALRQFEGRGAQSESFAVQLAAMDAKNEERFRTVFSELHEIKETVAPRGARKRRT